MDGEETKRMLDARRFLVTEVFSYFNSFINDGDKVVKLCLNQVTITFTVEIDHVISQLTYIQIFFHILFNENI